MHGCGVDGAMAWAAPDGLASLCDPRRAAQAKGRMGGGLGGRAEQGVGLLSVCMG